MVTALIKNTFILTIIYILYSQSVLAAVINPNDTVVFYGDSITTFRIYPGIITNYFSMRYPSDTIRFVNSSKSGDTAPGGYDRFTTDVLTYNPKVVTFMFGMNDSVYSDYNSTYISSLSKMNNLLVGKGAKSVMVSSTPRDDQNWNGYNNARISDMANLLKTYTQTNNIPYFNNFSFVTSALDDLSILEPRFAYTDDGVHPKFPGQTMLAYGLLNAINDTKKPSSVTIDTSTNIVNCTFCTITNLNITNNGGTFSKVDDSLPIYIHPENNIVKKYAPLENFNTGYVIKLNNLVAGDYDIFANNEFLGTYSNTELSSGVDLFSTIGPWSAYSEQNYHWSTMQLYDIGVSNHDSLRTESEARRLSLLADKPSRTWNFRILRHDPINFKIVSAPLHGNLSSITKKQDGLSLDYTPNSGYTGVDSFTYEVSIGSMVKTATVNLNIYSGNYTPTNNLIANFTFEDQNPITILVYPYLTAQNQSVSLNKKQTINLNVRWNEDKRNVNDYSNSGILLKKEDNVSAVSGKYGAGMSFDGYHDSLLITDAEKFNNSSSGSWAIWLKTDGNWGVDASGGGFTGKGEAALIYRQSTYGPAGGITLFLTPNGTTSALFTDITASNEFTLVSNKQVADNNWHHVVLTFNKSKGGVNKIYIDGVLSGQIASAFNWDFRFDLPIRVGYGWNHRFEEYKGLVDELSFYNKELSATEVSNLYNAVPTVSPVPSISIGATPTIVPSINSKFDVNKDGLVNIQDVLLVLAEIFK